jgi:hypothetical protein
MKLGTSLRALTLMSVSLATAGCGKVNIAAPNKKRRLFSHRVVRGLGWQTKLREDTYNSGRPTRMIEPGAERPGPNCGRGRRRFESRSLAKLC